MPDLDFTPVFLAAAAGIGFGAGAVISIAGGLIFIGPGYWQFAPPLVGAIGAYLAMRRLS